MKYFEGWYYKQQNQSEGCAVIPAIHNGEASIQIVTVDTAYDIPFGGAYCCYNEKGQLPFLRIGKNYFCTNEIKLDIDNQQVEVKGFFQYGEFYRLKRDVMGPFAYMPGMPCKHGVYSMKHLVDGKILVQDKGKKQHYHLEIKNGTGYMEGDCGNSFPKEYFWTQCNFNEGKVQSVMISVAQLPFPAFFGKERKLFWDVLECLFIKDESIILLRGWEQKY